MAGERQMNERDHEDLCDAVFHASNPLIKLINNVVHHYSEGDNEKTAVVGFIIRTNINNRHLQIIMDRLERIWLLVRQLNETPPSHSSHPYVSYLRPFVHHQSRAVTSAVVYCYSIKGPVRLDTLFIHRGMQFEFNSELVAPWLTDPGSCGSGFLKLEAFCSPRAAVLPSQYFFAQQLPLSVTAATADPIFGPSLSSSPSSSSVATRMIRTYVNLLSLHFCKLEVKNIYTALFQSRNPLSLTLRRLVRFDFGSNSSSSADPPPSPSLLLAFYITVKESRLEVRLMRRSILGPRSNFDSTGRSFQLVKAFNYWLSAASLPTRHLFYLNRRRSEHDAAVIAYDQRQVHIELGLGVLLSGSRPSPVQCNAHRRVLLANGRPLKLPNGCMVQPLDSAGCSNPLLLTLVPDQAHPSSQKPLSLLPITFNYNERTMPIFARTQDGSDED
ncbi:hypothetical protein TYRP_020097 [Tyrophagus putrescentiae]|nr:hypothetical protein TYRP_020097 [Tyrophagus putrescentiae]